MKKVQLDALSQSLSRAINPTARKQEATARILEQFEPLPVVAKPVPAPSQIPTRLDSASQYTGVNLTPVSTSDRCQSDTGVKFKPNTYDDYKHNNHHHSTADDDSPHQQKVKTAYCQITGNPWLPSDTEAYTASTVSRIPAHKAVETMHAVGERGLAVDDDRLLRSRSVRRPRDLRELLPAAGKRPEAQLRVAHRSPGASTARARLPCGWGQLPEQTAG
jgi:hypothetical protein